MAAFGELFDETEILAVVQPDLTTINTSIAAVEDDVDAAAVDATNALAQSTTALNTAIALGPIITNKVNRFGDIMSGELTVQDKLTINAQPQAAGHLVLNEASDNGTDSVVLLAPWALNGSLALTLPATLPSAAEAPHAVTIDENGLMSHQAIGGGANKMVKYVNNNTTFNMNSTGDEVDMFDTLEFNDDPAVFDRTSQNDIWVREAGRYRITAAIHFRSNGGRAAPNIQCRLGGSQFGFRCATGYIRAASGHNESSLFLQDVFNLQADTDCSVWSFRESTVTTTAPLANLGTSYFMIEKLS